MNQTFHPSIYIACFVILLITFWFVRTMAMERLTLGALVAILIFAALDMMAHAKDVRDASGKLVTRSVKAHGFETVREASTGTIKEVRETRSGVTTVRDPNGKVIRTERK